MHRCKVLDRIRLGLAGIAPEDELLVLDEEVALDERGLIVGEGGLFDVPEPPAAGAALAGLGLGPVIHQAVA
jgi:hypothetical protein